MLESRSFYLNGRRSAAEMDGCPQPRVLILSSVLWVLCLFALGALVLQSKVDPDGLNQLLGDPLRGGSLRGFDGRAPARQPAAPVPAAQPSSGRPGVDFVELVVAWYCEDFSWFLGIQAPVTVYAKNKQCLPNLTAALKSRGEGAGRVLVKELPNVGREGHSYMRHILDNYDTLATYTIFAQGAGKHNGVIVREKMEQFILSRDETSSWVPIVHVNHRGLLLYRDADRQDWEREAKGGTDRKSNVHVFPYFAHLDMANRARALYLGLFGGDACTMPPMIFPAGAQFIVRRETIRSRPLSFYKFLYDALAQCHAVGYDLERLWTYVWDIDVPTKEEPVIPPYCKGGNRRWMTWNCTDYVKQTEPFVPKPTREEPRKISNWV